MYSRNLSALAFAGASGEKSAIKASAIKTPRVHNKGKEVLLLYQE